MFEEAETPGRLSTSRAQSGSGDMELALFDNVQFIYELALAQLELRSMGVTFELTDSLRQFRLLQEPGDIGSLRRKSAYFKLVRGAYTDYFHIQRRNRTRSVNQYLTHWIYPYKGKFHPQMVRALLNIIGLERGDTVLDPFIGSGTTAVESQLLGINCIGVDVSPLCALVSRVKTQSIEEFAEILEWKDEILDRVGVTVFNQDQMALNKAIDQIPNEKVRNFYCVAKLVAMSDEARRRKEFTRAFPRNVDLMLSSVQDYLDVVAELDLKLGRADIRVGDCRALPLGDDSIDGIVTSPPYSIALDYVSNDAHALRALGCELHEARDNFIGLRGRGKRRIDLYKEDMKRSLSEMYRVLRPGRYAVIVIGNPVYQGREVPTREFVTDYAREIGLDLVKNIDKIIFGLYSVMQNENILIFRKVPVS